MSMLAERKQKQRWSLNPRGNSWINDKNNIGQKMLEKMGWSHGKGLGASETGIKEQIKVNYKNDNKGMGYQGNDEQWVEHEDNFNQLLETLSNGNNNNDDDKKIVSLVERSESSKVRVHYRKFTRGKDLSQYSEKDLANIFGKRSLKQHKMIENDDIGGGGEFEGSFMKNRGSMVDYFQQKSKQFQCNVDKVSGDEGEIRCNFGFISTPIDEGDNERKIDDNNKSMSELKTNKKKRKRIDDDSLENSRDGKKTESELIDENSQEFSGGKNKKKKIVKREIDEENTDVENSGKKKSKIVKNGASLENSNGNFHVVEKVEKRSKNWKITENGAIDNPVFNDLDSSLENSELAEQKPNFRIVKKVKKRLKCRKIEENGAIDNPVFNNSDSMENSHENFKQIENQSDELKTNFRIVGKVKKRLKNKENGAIDNPVFNSLDSSLENSYQTEENVGKLKKRSKNRKIDNPALNTSNSSLENYRVVGKAEKRLKCGKIKENRAIDNPAFEGLDSSLENSQNKSPPTVGKSKKKQKNKKIVKNGAIDNPAFDNLDSSGENLGNSKKQSKLHKIRTKTNKNSKNSPDNNGKFEIKRKTKIPFDNPTFNGKNSTETTPTTKGTEEISCDLMLNVVTTPILRTPNRKGANKGRNVRFSVINHERIIPNNDDLQKLNELTEINSQVINRNLEKFSQRIDGLEAEIENDMNEAKLHNTEGVVLKFNKNTKWGSVPIWLKKTKCTAKSSYKHLIKGDIVVNFKNTNLGEIPGYGKDLQK